MSAARKMQSGGRIRAHARVGWSGWDRASRFSAPVSTVQQVSGLHHSRTSSLATARHLPIRDDVDVVTGECKEVILRLGQKALRSSRAPRAPNPSS